MTTTEDRVDTIRAAMDGCISRHQARRILSAIVPALFGLNLADLRRANLRRQALWCPEQVPDISFRAMELGGEVGEALNVVKKLVREANGWRGSRATMDDLADEIADVIICSDLLAITAGIDLSAAVRRKFDATSDKVGLDVHLDAAPLPPAPARDDGTNPMCEVER